MNDLPQNELLSAYLDGELNAAERAEVEQLLAASPAARQLLEELRAVGGALRALPQEKLGDDLSRQVLRIAERRMLTEGEPGEERYEPTPLGRSLFRRFVNQRTMVWLGLTVAIAVLITINERQQGVVPPADEAKQLARAKSEPPARRPLPPSNIEAAPDANVLSETREESARPAAAPALEAKPAADGFKSEMAAKKPARAAAPLASSPQSTKLGRVLKKGGPAAEKSSPPVKDDKDSNGMLVVHCDISPEAAKQQTFEKLLTSNGIAWQQQPLRSRRPDEAKEKEAAEQKQKPPSMQQLIWRSMAAGERNSIYVEATPAQIEATIAGLEAQPKMFVFVSQKPVGGKQAVASDAGQGPTLGSGMAPAFQAQSTVGASAKQSAVGEPGADLTPAKQLEAEQSPAAPTQQQQRPKQVRQAQQSALRQRALFVLRIVGDDVQSSVKEVPASKK